MTATSGEEEEEKLHDEGIVATVITIKVPNVLVNWRNQSNSSCSGNSCYVTAINSLDL